MLVSGAATVYLSTSAEGVRRSELTQLDAAAMKFKRPDLLPNGEAPILLRREAIADGMSDASLKRAVRAGTLVRVRHGAYVDGELWSAADARERHVIIARAVHRTHAE